MRKLFIFIFLLAINQLFAQAPSIPPQGVEITKAIPPSADAASLGKFGRVPVSTFTGIPNISIPLYTIKSGDLTLPISLSYHAGGIKVEEQASSVGLGWALDAGGVITRTVRGMADEDMNGFLDPADYTGNVYNALNGLQPTNLTEDQAGIMLNKFVEGIYDGEADIFTFNFAGYSGQFTFDHHGSIIMQPQQNISISFPYSEGQQIRSFIATTPDGVKYYFGSVLGVDAVEYTIRNDPHQKSYNTAWLLKQIVSPSGAQINFTYQPEAYSQLQPGGTMYRIIGTGGTASRSDDNSGFGNGMHTMKLTGITFENGSIQVYSNKARLDINPYHLATGAKMIDTIAITSAGFSKLYRFYHTNTTSNRLRLDSLIGQLDPISGTTNYKKEKYSFSYNPDYWSQDTRFLNAQDWWGYYNGYNQTTLVPWMYDPINPGQKLPGAERKPDPGLMVGGTLTRITYPSNGYTDFTFEANQTPDYDFGADTYVPNAQVTAFSNDNQSLYYNYDSRNGNPGHLIHMYASDNPIAKMPLHLIAYGLEYGSNPAPPPFDYVTAYINGKDAQGNYTNGVYTITNTDTTIYLDPGYYAIQMIDNKNQTDTSRANYVKYSIAAIWSNHITANPSYHGHTASGLRVAKIEDYDGIHPNPFNVKTYKYNLNDSTSSGYLNYQPAYSYNLQIAESVTGPTTFFVRTAVSNYPLATQHGAVVGYYHVEEDFDSKGQKGKNDYYYSITGAEGVNGNGFPFAPPTTLDWHAGLLVKQVTSKSIGNGNFMPLQQKVNVYSTINTNSAISLKAGFNPYPYGYNSAVNYVKSFEGVANTYGTLIPQAYTNATDYTYLSSDTTWVYDGLDATKSVKTWNNYKMDSVTYQLTRLQSLNSKNELITKSVVYPPNAAGAVKGVSWLTGLNISSFPIEEITQKSNADGSNSRIVKAVLTSYKAKKPFRDTVFELQTVTPVSDFVSVYNRTSRDSRYKPVVSFDKYDDYGNIIQERKIGDAFHTYIWGYKDPNSYNNNTYPIAEIINADSANVAYTNFESYNISGSGNWTYNTAGAYTDATAPMGSQCFTVSSSNTLIKTGLTATTSYVISFWSKSGAAVTVTGGTVTNIATGNAKSGWLYHEYKVTGTATVTLGGTGLIDEVRLYPVTAQMSTYTYIPLVGMSGKCDTKNDITYYTFDNVGRLSQVLDQNRNILKDYQYNYSNTDAIWTDVVPANIQCVKDINGDNTGEQQKLQKDINPISVTYNHTRWFSLGMVPGSCPIPPPPTLYVKMVLTNSYTSGDTFDTYEFDVYRDAACTQHYSVLADLLVNYNLVITTRTNGVVTNTNTCHNNVLIKAGSNSATIGPIDMTGCITCNVGGGGGGGGALQSLQQSDAQSLSGTMQTQVGGGGTGTGCSSIMTLTTGTGYTPKF